MELYLIGMFLVAFLPLGVALFFVSATANKTRWGINLDAASTICPNCGAALPTVRKPGAARETRWTCAQCGTVIDKWGRALEHVAK